jgi:hypothetical protein
LNHLKAHAPILAAVMFGIGAAYAQQPPNASSASTPPATSPPAAPPTAAAPATASPPVAAAPSTPSAAVLRQAKLAGYQTKKLRDGTTVFCRNEAHIGSRFTSESCIDEPQLAEFLIRAQDQRDKLNNHRGPRARYIIEASRACLRHRAAGAKYAFSMAKPANLSGASISTHLRRPNERYLG